jgi:UDP-N-acetylglucosamine transferase subunit ALG13
MQEFPELSYVHLAGYNLKYGKKRWSTIIRIILQTPKILIKVNNENSWLNIFLKLKPVDCIISDNRFGLHAGNIPSIFITHQLYIKTGLGRLTDQFVQWLNYRRINRFATCWVPDHNGTQTLAGRLSNPLKLPAIPVRYIGGLSRLKACTAQTSHINLLVILSGPEPQRTIFENLLLKELEHQPGKTVLVRALPQAEDQVQEINNLTIYNHAPAGLLNELLCKAEMVISRSGYTTVMDLLKLGKKSILVPTPGQAEQEYLATHLYKEQLAYTVSQQQFSLSTALAAANKFAYQQSAFDMEKYKGAVRDLVAQIKYSSTIPLSQ